MRELRKVVRQGDCPNIDDCKYDGPNDCKFNNAQLLDDDEIDTLGGLIFSLVGRVPQRGEIIKHESGLIFEILDADPRKIKTLKIFTSQ